MLLTMCPTFKIYIDPYRSNPHRAYIFLIKKGNNVYSFDSNTNPPEFGYQFFTNIVGCVYLGEILTGIVLEKIDNIFLKKL